MEMLFPNDLDTVNNLCHFENFILKCTAVPYWIAFKDEEISGIGVLIFWVEISPIQMGWQGLFQYETMTLCKCWWYAPNSAGFCND